MERIRIRAAVPEDSAAVARMGNALNRHLGMAGDPFTTERVLEDGFGTAPRFSLLVAEMDGTAVGYAMYHAAYDSDIAAASIWLVDLYVDENARRTGAGRALMRALARETVRSGAKTLEWCVQDRNERAIAFYRALGAAGLPVRVMELRGEKLDSLASGTGVMEEPSADSTARRGSPGTRPGSDPEP